jgi:hypothetical protein
VAVSPLRSVRCLAGRRATVAAGGRGSVAKCETKPSARVGASGYMHVGRI